MPAPVSRKQARYMMAILHGKGDVKSARGDSVPKSVAGKYAGHGSTKDLPESKGKEHEGGNWDEKHHTADKKHVDEKRLDRKKKKAALRKAFEKYYGGKAAVAIVINDQGHILMGQSTDTNEWQMAGGHLEAGEDFAEGAKRELKEEMGLDATLFNELGEGYFEGNQAKVFLAGGIEGKPGKNTDGELKNIKFWKPENLPWINMRHCAMQALDIYFNSKLTKSLSDMVATEDLKKNIIRSQVGSDVVHEMSHADSLKLIGNGTFRFLRAHTKDMGDEDFKDIPFDSYTISIRKHSNDVYSGRITDGHKLVHQWTNKSLPGMAAELMSVFEWYSPEDEKMLEELEEKDLPDDALEGGIQALMDKYKKHNIGNIYTEMETIRADIRSGMAVDLQQVEQRMMKLFDKLESTMLKIVDKHNHLKDSAGDEVDQLHDKLKELQSKIDELSKKPSKVEAFSAAPANPSTVHADGYMYLSKPQVTIHPDGRITIGFSQDWSGLDKENFLHDMKAKALKKGKK